MEEPDPIPITDIDEVIFSPQKDLLTFPIPTLLPNTKVAKASKWGLVQAIRKSTRVDVGGRDYARDCYGQ